MLGTRNILFIGLFLVLIGALVTSIVLNYRDKRSRGRQGQNLTGTSRGLLGKSIASLPWAITRPITVLLVSLSSVTLFLFMILQTRPERNIWWLIALTVPILTYFSYLVIRELTVLRYLGRQSNYLSRQSSGRFSRRVLFFLTILICQGLLFFFLYRSNFRQARPAESSVADQEAIKELVQASQLYEVVDIYTDPTSFNSSRLAQYWVPSEQGGKDAGRINASVAQLQSKNWHYGLESKPENFEIVSVRLNQPNEGYATVMTSEKWFLPLYREDGTRVLERNSYLGPFSVVYTVRKFNGTWLIQDSTVPFR